EAAWNDFDFFFVHVKPTDSAGEDGDFDRKVQVIEEVDAQIPRLLKLEPAAILVTGDHSTPALFRAHSWHPVPFLIASQWSRWENDCEGFGERACSGGQLGRVWAMDLLPLLMAHAGRLKKFGACAKIGARAGEPHPGAASAGSGRRRAGEAILAGEA